MSKAISKIDAKKILQEERTARVRETIDERSEDALDSIVALSTDAVKENVRLDAAKDILDRAGYAPVQKIAIAQLAPITGIEFVLESETRVKARKK